MSAREVVLLPIRHLFRAFCEDAAGAAKAIPMNDVSLIPRAIVLYPGGNLDRAPLLAGYSFAGFRLVSFEARFISAAHFGA